MIDITMTAAIRPDVLKKTLASIKEHVKYLGELRLIINIDNRGDSNHSVYDVNAVVYSYFPNSMICICATHSPISKSQRRIWERSESEYVLNWEDDWQALRPIDLDKMKAWLLAYPEASMLYFDREDKGVLTHGGYSEVFEQLTDKIYKRLSGILLWSSPALVRQSYIKQALPHIVDTEYMDYTARTKPVQKFLSKWDFLTYVNGSPFVRDLGRPWLKENKLKGNKEGPMGYQWEAVNE